MGDGSGWGSGWDIKLFGDYLKGWKGIQWKEVPNLALPPNKAKPPEIKNMAVEGQVAAQEFKAIARGDAPAVHAETQGKGPALKVRGPLHFSSVDRSRINAGSSATLVDAPGIRATSHVTVTLVSNPGSAAVKFIELQPGTGFVVHMTGPVPKDVHFTYMIVHSYVMTINK